MAKQKPTKEEYQSDVLDLSRKILSGVQLRDIVWADSLRGNDRLEFLKFCSMVASHPMFDLVIAGIYSPNLEYAALKAENYDIVTFNRATANGISLVREYFMKYDKKFQEEFMKEEDQSDPHKSFKSVAE